MSKKSSKGSGLGTSKVGVGSGGGAAAAMVVVGDEATAGLEMSGRSG